MSNAHGGSPPRGPHRPRLRDGVEVRGPSRARLRDGVDVRCTRVRVRYAETDQMGVVYYANYEIVRRGEEVAAASGHTVHAALSRTGRPCRLPARVRELLA